MTDVNESMQIQNNICTVFTLDLHPSHTRPKFPLHQCKTGPMQYELARRRRNVVETDKDVILADASVF